MKITEMYNLYTVYNEYENFRIAIVADDKEQATELAKGYFNDSGMSYKSLDVHEFDYLLDVDAQFDCEYIITAADNAKAQEQEDIKDDREEKQDKCKDCAGCTQWKCDCSNTRAKALDDAMATLAKVICSDCGYLEGTKCKFKADCLLFKQPLLEKVISTLESLKATQDS